MSFPESPTNEVSGTESSSTSYLPCLVTEHDIQKQLEIIKESDELVDALQGIYTSDPVQLKELGNGAVRVANWVNAMMYYRAGILHAPHAPRPTENKEDKESPKKVETVQGGAIVEELDDDGEDYTLTAQLYGNLAYILMEFAKRVSDYEPTHPLIKLLQCPYEPMVDQEAKEHAKEVDEKPTDLLSEDVHSLSNHEEELGWVGDGLIYQDEDLVAKLRKDALLLLKHATSHLSNYSKAHLRRAECLMLLEQWTEANAAWDAFERSQPNNPHALGYIRLTWEQRKERERARSKAQEEMQQMLGQLKDIGNSFLGLFGMSTDNFKFDQDSETGQYNIRYEQ